MKVFVLVIEKTIGGGNSSKFWIVLCIVSYLYEYIYIIFIIERREQTVVIGRVFLLPCSYNVYRTVS